jgi:photosystem II stability/assembly factor-like uncharacterized protein
MIKSIYQPLTTLLSCLLVLLLTTACVTTGLATAPTSPWVTVPLNTTANPLDVAFSDADHGFLVGSNRLVMESNDGGNSWQERALELPAEENFRLISIDFLGQEGWIAGQPGLLLHSDDGGQNWTRLLLDTKLPGDPYLITATEAFGAELATNVGAIYRSSDSGKSWQAKVSDAAGAVRDLRRGSDGSYVSVSGLGNFFSTWNPGDQVWQPHNRVSSQRVQTMGFQPDNKLWMVTRGAQLRFNADSSKPEEWSKPVIPITNGYGYLDMAWDPNGNIWTGGGNGTLLSSSDGGSHWQKDATGTATPSNFTRLIFLPDGKGFALGERGTLLRWIG